MILDAPQLTGLGVGNDDLAGLHVPQQGRARSIQRAALASKDVAAAGQGADAQGAVAPGVPDRNELGGGHDHQTVCTLQHIHRLADGSLNAAHPQAVAGDEVADDLGIGGAVEDGTLVLQLTAQLQGIGQVAVVAEGMVPRPCRTIMGWALARTRLRPWHSGHDPLPCGPWGWKDCPARRG